MGYSEISVLLLVYSGLVTFFLVPFESKKNLINRQSGSISFIECYKESLKNILFHKKAILAFIFIGITLCMIWIAYDSAESHFNAHSGYPPISTDLKAIYSIGGVVLYTVVLVLLLAFLRTLKIVKDER